MRSYSIGKKSLIKTKKDLNNKSITILRGYGYGGWVNYIKDPLNKIKYEEANTHQSAFKMLQLGRTDYLLDYKHPATKVLEDMKIPELQHYDISILDCHFIVSKKSPNAVKFLKDIEKAYQQLVQQGSY